MEKVTLCAALLFSSAAFADEVPEAEGTVIVQRTYVDVVKSPTAVATPKKAPPKRLAQK